MLKIYIQIFGTIALVAILLINYNFFYRSPAQEEITAKRAELTELQSKTAVMNGIVAYQAMFTPVEQRIDKDRERIELDLPRTYSQPDRTKRIYDLILAANLEHKGINATAIAARPVVKITDFVSTPAQSAEFAASIASFQKAMDSQKGRLPEFLNADSPMSRFQFYEAIGEGKAGWKTAKLAQGFERHRYKLSLTGSYANVKKFLWLVNNDKPLLQATSVRILPRTGVGETRPFSLEVTIVAYADRNTVYEQMEADPTELMKTRAGSSDAPASDAPAADGAAAAPAAN